MLKWKLEITDKYERIFKRYEKKEPKILKAILANLAKYVHALEDHVSPQKITAGFIHKEPCGIKAIDQRGGEEKLKETRLYIYPDTTKSTLHLITIGDKKTQSVDIKFCNKYVKKIKERK
ncbi:MAG: hypothetical protein ACUZ8I_11255 [Candidatus Scalindua sp.]